MLKQRLLFSLCGLSMLIILSCEKEQNKVLPIYNPADFIPELVDKDLQNKSE